MSNHKKVRFPCNQCEFKAASKGCLKKHSCKYMRVASIYVINVTTKLDRKVVSKHIKYQFIRESGIYVIIVTTKLNGKAISKHMKGQFMRVSSIHVINATTKLHKKQPQNT